jgi:CheY-like chemotaxis protein
MARVLMADDEVHIRELVRRYAERDGHEVTCVADGAQAIAQCE